MPASALLFPLAIRENFQSKDQLVRTILSIDEEAQSMTFAGDMPVGYKAQLMRCTNDRLVDGATDASQECHADELDSTKAVLAVAISCVGRRIVLGERTEEEVDACLEVFPESTKQIGFYSYGEISPVGNEFCNLHNQTMTVTIFSEQ